MVACAASRLLSFPMVPFSSSLARASWPQSLQNSLIRAIMMTPPRLLEASSSFWILYASPCASGAFHVMQEYTPLDNAQQAAATGDMRPEDFRRYGHQIVDWIADYLADVGSYPVLSQVAPGDIRHALPAQPPEQPEAMEAILADFDRVLMPGITHWNSPGFMAYFGITGSGPGILGEMLSGALNVNAMLWRTSPAAPDAWPAASAFWRHQRYRFLWRPLCPGGCA